jgi:hypothetical protein
MMNRASPHDDAIAEIVDRVVKRFVVQIGGWAQEIQNGVFRDRGWFGLGNMDQCFAQRTTAGNARHRVFDLQTVPIGAFYLDRHRSLSQSCPLGEDLNADAQLGWSIKLQMLLFARTSKISAKNAISEE